MVHSETEKYFSKPSEIVVGSADNENTCIRKFSDIGVYFRNFSIDSGKGGEPVELLQITDVHFNYCNEEDLKDPELAYTVVCRKWNGNADSVRGITKSMELSKYFDKTIVTGDTLDYLSMGSIELLEKYIWGVDKDALVALGGHELTKQMETGKPDLTPLSDRLALLQKHWRHDIHYHSEVIGDKVLVAVLDNSQSKYPEGQAEKLKADIDKARREKLVLLIFEHEPLSTGNPEDSSVKAIMRCDPEYFNFYSGPSIGSTNRNEDEPTKAVYSLITNNADVIRGIFCGHEHSAFYTEIKAKTPDGKETTIPQVNLEGNPYNNQAGHVLRITIS